jgi:hypothetical protein
MSRTQGYTWEDVMLSIDIRNEAEKERQQQQKILDEQLAEESAMGWWSLGLSVLGGALLGPVGYAAGKIIGRGVGDITHDWEDMAVDTGKFYKKEAEEFKRTRDKAATDQTQGQVFDAVTDLAMMYVQAGGLQEGPTDLTTFGSGEDAWSVFGKGEAALPAIQTSAVGPSEFGNVADIIPGVPASPDYVPSLFSEWKKGEGFLKNIKPIGKKLKSANTDISTLNTLYQSWLSGEEEKAAS